MSSGSKASSQIAAADHAAVRPGGAAPPGEVGAAARRPGDERGHHKGRAEGEEGREIGRHAAQQPGIGAEGDRRRQQHGADADGVDVEQMRPLEFYSLRAEAEPFIDDQISHQRAHPAGRDIGIDHQRVLDGLGHARLHQQQRDNDVEDQPHHAARMGMGEAREEVRPRERPGIGVGDVDLDLRHHDQRAGRGDRDPRRQNGAEGQPIHLRRLHRLIGQQPRMERHIGEQAARQQLDDIDHDPAGAAKQQRRPPSARADRLARRQEADEIDLLGRLRDHREEDRGCRPESREIKARNTAPVAAEADPAMEPFRMGDENRQDRHQVEHEPDRLRPQLQPADEGDAVRHQRHHDDRA